MIFDTDILRDIILEFQWFLFTLSFHWLHLTYFCFQPCKFFGAMFADDEVHQHVSLAEEIKLSCVAQQKMRKAVL